MLSGFARMTLSISTAPKNYVEQLGDDFSKPEPHDQRNLFAHALFNETLTRKMNDAAMKGCIGAITKEEVKEDE